LFFDWSQLYYWRINALVQLLIGKIMFTNKWDAALFRKGKCLRRGRRSRKSSTNLKFNLCEIERTRLRHRVAKFSWKCQLIIEPSFKLATFRSFVKVANNLCVYQSFKLNLAKSSMIIINHFLKWITLFSGVSASNLIYTRSIFHKRASSTSPQSCIN